MRQRLGIADVLIKDPEIIFLDEPTLGLDPEGTKELLNLILELGKREGKTVLISSHLLHQVQAICDRVGIFVKGKLVAIGSVSDLAKEIGSEVIVELKTSNMEDFPTHEVNAMPGISSVQMEKDMIVIKSDDPEIAPKLVRELNRMNIDIYHVRSRSSDLDDIYSRYFHEGEAKLNV